MKIAFVGGGVMAEAIIGGIIDAKIASSDRMSVLVNLSRPDAAS